MSEVNKVEDIKDYCVVCSNQRGFPRSCRWVKQGSFHCRHKHPKKNMHCNRGRGHPGYHLNTLHNFNRDIGRWWDSRGSISERGTLDGK